MIHDAFVRQRAHAQLRRLTDWDDLTIDRALRERPQLQPGSVIGVNSAGVAVIAAPAPRRAS